MTRSRARLAAPLAIVLSGGLFFGLTRGMGGVGTLASHGYAEDIDSPAAPLAAGRVARVAVHVGQSVKAGDVVAVMDTVSLDIQLETARLGLSRAKAELGAEEVTAGAATARAELLVLRLQSTQTRDRAQLAEVQAQLDRLQKLAGEQLVQARDVEQQKLKEADLKANLALLDRATEERRAGLGKAQGGRTAAADLDRRLAPLREAVRAREEAVKLAQLAVDEATVRARADGVVSLILHRAGEIVPAATEIVRIVSGRPGRIVCWIPERDLAKVELGRDVRLRGQGFWSARWGGRVAEVAPEIEEVPIRARVSPQVPAWGRRVEIESWPPRPLLLGEGVHVRF
jgi:multidrug resistance efflux pump